LILKGQLNSLRVDK